MRHWKKIFLSSVIIGLGTLILFATAYIAYTTKEKNIKDEAIKRQKVYNKILDAASTKPTEITISYNNPISTGSPLIFGGVHSPNLEQTDAWNQIAEAGATSLRTDFFLEYSLPSNISLKDYKSNKNKIRDPSNWNINFINQRKEIYMQAKKRGLKTIGIVSFAPKWLTYSHTERGIPMDWSIYEDIVKKTYSIYRNDLDYVEIWNEPTYPMFLDLAGSPYSRADAYKQIFYHAAKAIREVDHEKNDGKVIPIGGSVGHNPTDTSILERILQDPKTKQYINFVSYHNYVQEEPSWSDYKKVLKKYNMQNIPIFLTEWNYDSEEKIFNPYKDSDPAIIYTGEKFLDFLRMGLAGANYYSFLEVKEATNVKDAEYLGFYRLEKNKVELLPQAKTWRILSKDMALGNGRSTIYQPKTDDGSINTIGFTNVNKDQGMVIINASLSPYVANMQFTNLSFNNYAKVQVFYASKENDAKVPIYESTLKIENHATVFDFYVPEETIMAVKLTQEKDWFNLFIHH